MGGKSFDAAGRERRGERILLATLVATALLVRGEALISSWGYDCGAWMLMSRVMNDGHLPYDDIWDNKMPPILWLGQLYLKSGFPHLAMYAVEVLSTVAAALGIAAFLRRMGASRRTGLFFGGASVLTALPAWEGAHRIELHAVACLSWGLALLAAVPQESGSRRLRSALGAGFAMAAACSFHPQQGLLALGGALFVPWLARDGRTRVLASYVGGGLLAAGLLCAVAASGGYFQGMLRDAVQGSFRYAGGDASPGASMLGKTIAALVDNVERLSLAWIVALCGALALWSARSALPRVPSPLGALGALAAFTWAGHLAVSFLTGHQWLHYHYPEAWSAALLGGAGWVALARARNFAWPLAPEAVLAVAALVVAPSNPHVYAAAHKVLRGRDEGRSERVEKLIAAHVPRDQGVLIFDAYDAIGALVRLPNPLGSRWVVGGPQYMYGDPEEARQSPSLWVYTATNWGTRLLETIDAEAGDWVVRERGRQDRLTAVLAQSFEPVAESEEFVLYRRRAARG